jgi:hypothetical protein
VKLTTHLHLVPRSNDEWSYTSTPQYASMVWCSVKKKHRVNFTFTFNFKINKVEDSETLAFVSLFNDDSSTANYNLA